MKKNYIYYGTQETTCPDSSIKEGLIDFETFDSKTYVKEINAEAWTRQVYNRQLSDREIVLNRLIALEDNGNNVSIIEYIVKDASGNVLLVTEFKVEAFNYYSTHLLAFEIEKKVYSKNSSLTQSVCASKKDINYICLEVKDMQKLLQSLPKDSDSFIEECTGLEAFAYEQTDLMVDEAELVNDWSNDEYNQIKADAFPKVHDYLSNNEAAINYDNLTDIIEATVRLTINERGDS
ncbi:hypothetical protein M2146_001111 [Lachnospiraceae bacterium PF1-22]